MSNSDKSDGWCNLMKKKHYSPLIEILSLAALFVVTKEKKQCPFAQALSRLLSLFESAVSAPLFAGDGRSYNLR